MKTKEYDTEEHKSANSIACAPAASTEQKQHRKTKEYDTESHFSALLLVLLPTTTTTTINTLFPPFF